MGLVTRERLLTAAIVGVAVLALLPSRLVTPWSEDVALLLTAPIRPAQRMLAAVHGWMRPAQFPDPSQGEALTRALEERDALQGELDRLLLHYAALESQLRELRAVTSADTRGGWRPISAVVVERPGGRRANLLGLSVGKGQGVQEGDPVVVGGNRLVGRILGPVDGSRAWVVPLDDSRVGRIDALAFPVQKGGASARSDGVMLQLRAIGDGRLLSELDRTTPISPGDVVLLNDATWRSAARGMRIGVVEHVGALDSNPLRAGVTVRMDVLPTRVSRVTVKVVDEPANSAEGGGG